MDLMGARTLRTMPRAAGDPDDPHDGNYLADTSRKYNRLGDMPAEDQDFDADHLDQVGRGQKTVRKVSLLYPKGYM